MEKLKTYEVLYGRINIGAIAGIIYKGAVVEKCINTATIKATNMTGQPTYIGGIAANGTGKIISSYNTGEIIAQLKSGTYSPIGGITGAIRSGGLIENCYNVGNVNITGGKATQIAAIAGEIDAGKISNTYYLDTTSKCAYYTTSGSGSIIGKSTQSIMLESSFIDTLGEAFKADSNNINNGYPILKWQ